MNNFAVTAYSALGSHNPKKIRLAGKAARFVLTFSSLAN